MFWRVLICILCIAVVSLFFAVIKANRKTLSGSEKTDWLSLKLKTAEEDLRLRQTEFSRLQDAFDLFKKRTIHNLNELNDQDKSILTDLDDLRSDTSPVLSMHEEQITELNSELHMLRSDIKKLDEKLFELQREMHIILNPAGISKGLNDPIEPTPTFEIADSGLNEEKQQIFHEIEYSHDNFFITGKGGTGKSYLLNYFRNNTHKRVLCTAPTGIAALNVKGVTIHRAFGYYNLRLDAEPSLSKGRAEVLKNADAIIIDEISMVRSDVLQQIDAVLRFVCKNDEPFGGKQMLFFGDVFQLPPVVKEKDEQKALYERFGGVWFFHAPVYGEGNFRFRELKELFRFSKGETSAEHIAALDHIRDGSFTQSDLNLFNSHPSAPAEDEIITLVPDRKRVAEINEKELSMLPHTTEYLYASLIEWKKTQEEYNDNQADPDFPVETDLKLRVGALVMFCSNDLNKRWVNGTLGIVSELSENTVKVSIEGSTYPIEKEVFSQYTCKYDRDKQILVYEPIATLTQYPLRVAYAITIHKSQGMTYPKLQVDLSGCFAEGQAYVALSRCSNFDTLYLREKIDQKDIKYSSESINFYDRMTKA